MDATLFFDRVVGLVPVGAEGHVHVTAAREEEEEEKKRKKRKKRKKKSVRESRREPEKVGEL